MGEKNENSSEKFYHDSEAFWSFFCIWFGFLSTYVSSGNCEIILALNRTWAVVLGVPVRGKNLIGWNLFASDVPLEPRAKLGE